MEKHEHEQMIIRLDYIDTMCNELLGSIQGKIMERVVVENGGERGQQFRVQDKQFTQKIYQIDKKIESAKQQQKKLLKQIFNFKQSIPSSIKNNLTNKAIRQLSSVQYELSHTRRLLNSELQNLNTINISNGQLSEGICKMQQRQTKLRNKLFQLSRQQRDYMQCQQLQFQYQQLLSTKNHLLQQSSQQLFINHSSVSSKLTAIAQSAQNLKQMHSYQHQLTQLLIEQNFIIEEISSRESIKAKRQNSSHYQDNDNNDQNIFQQEVQQLRKTIANRKFFTQRHSKKSTKNRQLEKFLNHPTPKNASIQNEKSLSKQLISMQQDNNTDEEGTKDNKNSNNNNSNKNYESIFKISVQPVSHSKHVVNEQSPLNQLKHLVNQSILHNNQPKIHSTFHRNSLPSKLSQIQINQHKLPQKYPNKSINNTKIHSSNINALNSFEISALEKILKNKEDQMQTIIITNQPKSPQGKLNQPIIPLPKTNTNYHHHYHTQPIQTIHLNDSPQIKGLNNSRFIQRLIQTKNHQKSTQNSVRIRTKKSYSQSHQNYQIKPNNQTPNYQQHHPINKYHQNTNRKKVNFSLQQRSKSKILPPFEKKMSLTKIKQQQARINPLQHKSNQQNDIDLPMKEHNEFLQLSSRKKLIEPKRKYKEKVFELNHEQNSIDSVFKRIQEIKKTEQENKQKEKVQSNRAGTDRIRIFKLSTARKYGNPTAFKRKGVALGVEESGSQSEEQVQQQSQALLPKVVQQQESIRNTLQSVVQHQNSIQK